MDFDFSPELRQFRDQVRSFIAEEAEGDVVDPARETTSQLVDTPDRRRFMKKMANRGWLGLSWPKEYGGHDMSGIYEYILNEELACAGAPLIGKGVGIIGRTLIRHGSEKLKREFLPQILNAEIEFAIGYTEPEAGSDLASMSLRAQREGEDWVLNGQKLFTTSAHFADWYWLAARTDTDARKHAGISLFLIPMNATGITIQGMETIGDERTNEVFFDDVRVSNQYVVGEENKGWYYICEALDYERFTLFTVGPLQQRFEKLRRHIRDKKIDGIPLTDDPEVRRMAARLATDIEVARMHILRVIDKASRGEIPNIEAAESKLWSTNLAQRLANAALDMLGPQGQLRRGSPYAPADGKFEHSYRCTVLDTIGGGTSEVQKNIISRRHLGLNVH